MKSFIRNLKCSRCHKTYAPDKVMQLCTSCNSPLIVEYDLNEVKLRVNKEDISKRNPDLWRYFEFLPLKDENNKITLGEGMTPIVKLNNLGKEISIEELYMKDESSLPTGTFKARGAAVGVSKAKELGIKTIAMPTNGNAGAAWATYAARAGIECIIVMPEDAPYITKAECSAVGATLYEVKGVISDAAKIVSQWAIKYGWFDASTWREPYRVEGKKTIGFEIAEQFDWEVPDIIVCPTGGGMAIVGIFKAIKELQEVGWIGKKIPKLVAVQSSQCAPIVKAWIEKKRESQFWNKSSTIAFGINVPKSLGDFMVLEAIYNTEGCAIDVSDDEILSSQEEIATKEGLFICPEGAATFAAVKKLRKKGFIKENDKVVLLNTGMGLKYFSTVKISTRTL